MLPNSLHIVAMALVVMLLAVILVRLRGVLRYFYTPEPCKGPGTKYPPIPNGWRPTPPIQKDHRPHHRRRSYGRHG